MSSNAARAQFEELATRIGSDPNHPLWPELLDAARRGLCRAELQAWLHNNRSPAADRLSAARLLELCETAAELGLLEDAVELAALAHYADEPRIALRRGAWCMQLGRYEQALQASNVALCALLQPGLALEEFLLLVARGAPPEGLLRYSRDSVARRASLSEPIALRWEAARRLGLRREADLMRLLCLRYFPERASVWASAGNQALDEDDIDSAAGYFRRCLAIDSNWTAGLAGMAIVLERQKNWAEALPFRRRVVEVERALETDTGPSLQRVVRYAAALARLARWGEAEPLFRRCVVRGAYASLPAERPVLVRVFSRELYSPALIASFQAHDTTSDEPAPEVRLALHEAELLAGLYRALDTQLLRGVCAWLLGDMAHAYELFDEAELALADDVCVQYFLLDAARALAAPERASIESYAADSARRVLACGADAGEEGALYAALTLERLGLKPQVSDATIASGPLGLASLHTADPTHVAPLEPFTGEPRAGLRRIAAFRACLRARGASPLTAAAMSSGALTALQGTR